MLAAVCWRNGVGYGDRRKGYAGSRQVGGCGGHRFDGGAGKVGCRMTVTSESPVYPTESRQSTKYETFLSERYVALLLISWLVSKLRIPERGCWCAMV